MRQEIFYKYATTEEHAHPRTKNLAVLIAAQLETHPQRGVYYQEEYGVKLLHD